jgi:glutathione S-transferase
VSDEIILHHYWTSPFSEKVRVMLGIKGAAWRSVIQPVIMPKPDLVPLTGGYRRIPVMQIGADVFLDSAAILAEIERRFPEPKVIHGADWAINAWADRQLFQPTVAIIFGALGDAIDPAFVKDREALSGRPFDAAAMKAAGPMARAQFAAAMAWLDAELANGAPFLGGQTPSLSDIAFYLNVWFHRAVLADAFDRGVAGLPRIGAWRERIVGLGHGTYAEMTPAAALDIAAAAEPSVIETASGETPEGLSPGAAVIVSADDYGRDPIAGTLVAADAGRIVIGREDPRVGRVDVHFPRAGYVLSAA